MRDWNPYTKKDGSWYWWSIQPTYEGLKRFTMFMILLLSLYSAYLWGIETCHPRVLQWLPLDVFSLPMRDWNVAEAGPEVIIPLCIQPTYEGLKLYCLARYSLQFRRIQPTYEGLKRSEWWLEKWDNVKYSAYLWGIETSKVRHIL